MFSPVPQIRAAEGFDWLTCAGFETIVSEVKKGTKEDSRAIEEALKEICYELTKKTEEGVKVSIAPFIFWKGFEDSLRKTCNEVWKTLQNDFRALEFLPRISNLRLSDDGIHLQDKSAAKYIEGIVDESLATWLRESEDMDVEDSGSDIADSDKTIVGNQYSTPVGTSRRSFKAVGTTSALADVRNELKAFKRSVEYRLDQDLLMFAKHEEALDVVRNEKFLDRVVFSGVEIKKLEGKPMEKVPILKKAVHSILEELIDLEEDEDGNKKYPNILFITHLNPQIRSDYRVIEARFETKEIAATIREKFGKRKKEMRLSGVVPDALRGVNINLSLTRETRVRIEVLKAFAKVISANTNKKVSAYVLQFSARPMLKVIIKKDATTDYTRVLGYTEAIEFVKENYDVGDQDLFQAYNKAGNMKRLEQKFVVLKSATFNQTLSNDETDHKRKKLRK